MRNARNHAVRFTPAFNFTQMTEKLCADIPNNYELRTTQGHAARQGAAAFWHGYTSHHRAASHVSNAWRPNADHCRESTRSGAHMGRRADAATQRHRRVTNRTIDGPMRILAPAHGWAPML